MTNTSTPLDLTTLKQELRHCAIGHTVHYYAQTASTMPLAHAEMAAARAKMGESVRAGSAVSGTIFITEEQTAGRGRLTRSWQTPPGTALLVSILLAEPHLTPALRKHPQLMPMLSGVAAARTLSRLPIYGPTAESDGEQLGQRVALKWPNDLLLATDPAASPPAFGKTAGILLESAFRNGLLDYVVIGIGLNVNQTQAQLPPAQNGAPPPVSLRSSLGRCIDRTMLLVNLCRNVAAVLTETAAVIFTEWRDLLHTLGQPVTVRTMDDSAATAVDAENRFEGTAIDVTPDGDLVVENARQERRQFNAGVVTLRPR